MVKNINSAFGRGLQDTRDMGRRPLLSEPPEPKMTVAEKILNVLISL